MRRVLSIFALAALALPAVASAAGPFGIGIVVGEPTGVSMNYYVAEKSSIDAAFAWSFEGEGSVHLQADYLWHHVGGVTFDDNSHRIPFYVGIGGRWKINDKSKDQIGVRIPVGVEFRFTEKKNLEVFGEIAPILDLAPDTEFRINAAIGARFYF